MSEADVDAVVSIHLRAFKTFFLTSLGRQFLAILYRECSRSADVAIVATDEMGHAVGFAVGSINTRRLLVRLVLRRPVHLAIALLPAVLREPTVILRLRRRWGRTPSKPVEPVITLLSIATDPVRQREGFGRRLVTQFCDDARELGVASIELSTDALANQRGNEFYLDNGFRLVEQYVTAEGRAMNLYSRNVSAR